MSKVNNINNAINSSKVNGNLQVSQKIEFPKNKIIDAKLLKKEKNGEALIKIGNYNIKAKMPENVFLREGDQFKLQFTGKENNIWNFRFISINRTSIFYKIPTELINSHLINLKLPIVENSMEIAKALFKYNLPLNQENYKLLLPYSNNNSKLYLEAAAFLRSINIPITENNVKVMYEFLTNNQLLTNILYQIHFTLNQTGNINPIIMGIIQTLITNILKDPNKKEGEKIKNLTEITNKKLKSIINELDRALEKLPKNTKENLEKLSNILKGIYLINTSLKEEKTAFTIIPAIINGFPTTVELKIFYYVDKELKKVVNNRFSFELTVNAPTIGPVIISSSVIENNISTHIKKSQLPEETFINKKDLLQKMLQKENYNLGNYIVKYVDDINIEESINLVI